MGDLHRRQPLCFRTADADDEQWVRQQAADAGLTPYAFLARLVHDARIAGSEPSTAP